MEEEKFDRSDFNELLGYLKDLRGMVDTVQVRTDAMCNSFNSGLEKVGKTVSKINLTGLSNKIVKLQEDSRLLNEWVAKTVPKVKEIGIANAEATVSFMASASEMSYNVLSTVASLNKLSEIKITTDAEENQKALEGVIGTGERMQELFDEIQANPLLKTIGGEKDLFAKFRSRWEVLRDSKEGAVRMMTTLGKVKEEFTYIRQGFEVLGEYKKERSFKGFGGVVKAIFKKKEKQPGEEKQKNGFFSIFRKKGEDDKNWFSAVGHRFNEYKDRTVADVKNRITPLADYVSRITAGYSPLAYMAETVVELGRLGEDFNGQAKMTWLRAANGWGIGNREMQEKEIAKLEQEEVERGVRTEEKRDRMADKTESAWKVVGQMNRLIGKNPKVTLVKGTLDHSDLQSSILAPEIAGIQSQASDWNVKERPVEVHVDRLVENLNITSSNMSEGVDKMREMVVGELRRILNNVNSWACETNLN